MMLHLSIQHILKSSISTITKLNFVSIHGVYPDISSGLSNFPLKSYALYGGGTSLWWDKSTSQWMIDSVMVELTLGLHTGVRFGFSLMTARIPYLNTEQGPIDYDATWRIRSDFGDDITLLEPDSTQWNLTIDTAYISTVNRHISEPLHRAYYHYAMLTHLLSGGGGPGILYGFPCPLIGMFQNITIYIYYNN